MGSPAERVHSPEEYLALERKAEYKSEYIGGRVLAMSGASREHNTITLNIAAGLRSLLKGRDCDVYVSDMRVKVGPTVSYTYPDVSVVCGSAQFEDRQVDTLLNPGVIFEVLSPSTEAYDRGEKFARYRRLRSLTDYVLVAQDRVHVEHYKRVSAVAGDGDSGEVLEAGVAGWWMFTEIDALSGTLQLASISCALPLAEIYERVPLPPGGQT